jgi:hypothetical protein
VQAVGVAAAADTFQTKTPALDGAKLADALLGVFRTSGLEIAINRKKVLRAASFLIGINKSNRKTFQHSLVLAQGYNHRLACPEQQETLGFDHLKNDLPALARLFIQGCFNFLQR